jgi:hypothetical protein
MEFRTWKPVYEGLLAAFGYPQAGDERARDRLGELVAETETYSPAGLELDGRTVAIAGAGPSLETETERAAAADAVLAASTAVDRLRAAGVTVDAMVTDLDKNPETGREGRSSVKLKFAVGAAGTASVAAYAYSTGGIVGKVLPLFALIEVAKGLPAAIKVADMEAAKVSKWFDFGFGGPMPKRKAVTTMFFGVTGFLEFFGYGLWSFLPAAAVLAYALARRFQANR